MVMKMDNSRRTFDRSREPGLKKPRLAQEVERVPNFTSRPSMRRPVAQQRFRANDGGSANSDLEDGGYQPQPLPHQELVSQYKTALAELTFNSKPIITNLTIIAGENLLAAKAIAAAVCFNILEVPSEQKLPSLYLLDSIVKNIGRDYIKYFAARLPEVFCKAYEQVDPPIHSSMRHLFGTWKGVFPPQTLQIIEKELAFNSTIGSSSGSISSRPDSQAQRPPHSIHVNPRYLERQRLQQSKVKEGTNDVNAVSKNLTKDLQRPDRATDTAAGRPWDSHHSLRTTPSGIAQEKNTNSSYEEYEKGNFSRNSALGKRMADDGRERPWSGAGTNVEESRSGQSNGFINKPGFSNYPVPMPKSTSSGTRIPTMQSFVDRNSNGLSSSWKHSEEEEYSWDDMNSRLTDHGSSTAHNLRKDQLTPDNSDKLQGYENRVSKLPGRADVAVRADRESSSDSLSSEHREVGASGQQPPLVWQIQEAHSFGDPIDSGPPGLSSGYRESSIPIRTSDARSSGQVSGRLQVGKSISGPSAFGPTDAVGQRMSLLSSTLPLKQSSISQHHHSHQSCNLTEDEPQQIQSSQRDQKASSYSGTSSIGKSTKYSQDSVHVQLPKYPQLRDAQALAPSGPTSQSKRHFLVSQPLESESQSSHSQKPLRPPLHNLRNPTNLETSLSGNVLTENSEESSTRDLLAAVMKSGILSNSSVNIINLPGINLNEIEKMTPELSIQPDGESGSPPTELMSLVAKIAGTSSLGPLSSESTPVYSKFSPSTVGQPSVLATTAKGVSAETENGSSKSSNPFSNLLNSLVAKGLISASKEDLPNNNVSETSSQPEILSPGDTSTSTLRVSSAPVFSASPLSSAGNDIASSEADVKSGITLPHSTVEINSVIGYEFRPDTIRKFHSSVISKLFDNIPYQCSICGMRLKYQEQQDAHLQWHASKKQEANDLNQTSRRWYVNPVDWSARKVGRVLNHEPACSTDECGKIGENEPMVPADETQCVCVLCGELFEDIYSLERDEWMFKGAVYMSILMADSELGRINQSTARGPIVHANCVTESSAQDLGLASDVKTEMSA